MMTGVRRSLLIAAVNWLAADAARKLMLSSAHTESQPAYQVATPVSTPPFGPLGPLMAAGPSPAPAMVDYFTAAASNAPSILSMADRPENTCDVTTAGPLCFSNQGRSAALLPNAIVPGLVGHWTFDEDVPLDASGSGNHGSAQLVHGPAPAGSGQSAVFTNNFLTVQHSPLFSTPDFSYSFWVFVPDDGTEQIHEVPSWCPLLRKGIYSTAAQQYSNSPALMYSRRTGHLRASISTNLNNRGEYIDSNARVMPNRWVHLAIVHHRVHSSLLVYVNGILDVRMKTRGAVVPNTFPLFVGGDPFTAGECDQTVYIDDVKAYSRALTPHELQAEAAPALGGADPAYVHLGCLSCTLPEAVRSCPQDRHVCTALELHTGGYQVSRALGWLGPGTHVWTRAAIDAAAQAERNAYATPTPAPAPFGGMGPAPAPALGLLSTGPSPSPGPVPEHAPPLVSTQAGLGLCCSGAPTAA